MPFTIAIIGRPNVGKSTLFNRLVGRRLAIVDDTPGVTRDRREGEGKLGDMRFRVIDTAGLEDVTDDSLEARMRAQTERALDEADVALMVIDARAGVTPLDQHFVQWLRGRGTPTILVANKCEGRGGEAGMLEGYSLGLDDPVALSAEHGLGLSELHDRLKPYADLAAAEGAEVYDDDLDDLDVDYAEGADIAEDGGAPEPKALQLAIVGRPNVGKSTMINRLLGEDRMLTGPEAGITRDAISVMWHHGGRDYRLIDTAGLRRKARVTDKLEYLSTRDTMRAVRFAHVVVLVLDADAVLEKQDLTIARQVVEEGRALIIAVNKWDAATDRRETIQRLSDRLQTSLPQVRGIPVITCSALTGHGMDRLLPTVNAAYDTWNARIGTGDLNRWLLAMQEAHPAPMGKGGKRIRLRYATQAKTRPPTFIVFCTRAGELPDSYTRFLVNGLRDDFGLDGVPIRLIYRKGDNPYAAKKGGDRR
ncbi:MAG: ribosome biogenesis GTPase Der [Rhodospirillales bacterium CG15_BIG_FIL_POST_REV_8_21_14_020_66_15]|nr:MAG: ribosome biogenesis GTPase Der [Rhodospirillales bacterium CG15_BIG_FIL_POST_REV_8_21_14_020_66_15]